MRISLNIFAYIGIYKVIQYIWQEYELHTQKKITVRNRDTIITLILSLLILIVINLTLPKTTECF